MAYTIDDLERDIATIQLELAVIRKDRGKRYGRPEDTLHNVRSADPLRGWRAAYINAIECLNRLEKYFLKRKIEIDNKDFENAAKDLINYSQYILILYRKEK
jgi:hypothetical protein